jgi:hypothetical protein
MDNTNTNNINNINNIFNPNRLKQHNPGLALNADFEARVFARIKKKKKQRKVAASAALSIAVLAFLFIGQAVLFHREPGEKILIGQNARNPQIKTSIKAKEEVPVMENVVFASYDHQTDYAIEQVAYNQHENTI